MSESTQAEVRRVVESLPELKPLLREHLQSNNGEMLPHVFFGDLCRWAVAQDAVNSPSVEALLGLLDEDCVAGDLDVRELIVVSFLENIPMGSRLPLKLGRHLLAAGGYLE
jgi:hypothetical protein